MYSKNDITVVINTFNSGDQIYSCLDKIDSNIKVVIIENSNDYNFKKKIEAKYQNVQCDLALENLGYGKGNNLGLKKVKTRFALILNPDAKLKEDTINNFFKTALEYKDFAIIGPGIQEKNEKHNSLKEVKVAQVENLKGFAMFLNLQQFKEVGYFDENFFIYFEEIDLCRRLKKNNKKIYLDQEISIDHIGGSSHDERVNFEMELSRNWHWMWSSFYYNKKYYGFTFAFSKYFLKLVSSIIKVFYFLIINKPYKRKIYYQRFSGLTNSIIGKNSWYRPKI